ncbi:hypothetical protein ACU680_04580 [Pseudomonas koreensis]
MNSMMTVARELAPARVRSARKSDMQGVSAGMGLQGLGLLRSPAGASSLATGMGNDTEPVGAAEGCDLLLWLFSMSLKIKIKRSQPAAAPTLLNPTLNLRSKPVVRGFIPDGLRSSPKANARGESDVFGCQVSGLLRSPSGINPLTTRNPLSIRNPLTTGTPPGREIGEVLI